MFLSGYALEVAEQENEALLLLNDETILFPNRAPEKDGGFDIGFGHKLTEEERATGKVYGFPFNEGITVEVAKRILLLDIKKHTSVAERIIGRDIFSALPQTARELLTDYAFTGVLYRFRNFRRAFLDRDYVGTIAAFERKFRNKKGALIPMRRRNAMALCMINQLADEGYFKVEV